MHPRPFEAAKAIPLTAWLSRHLGEPSSVSGGVRFSICPSCGEPKRGEQTNKVSVKGPYWKCHKCAAGGSIVDAAAAIWGVTAIKAANKLLDDNHISGQGPLPAPVPKTAEQELAAFLSLEEGAASLRQKENALSEVMQSIRENARSPLMDVRVAKYLQYRGISAKTAGRANHRGILSCLPSTVDSAKLWLTENAGEIEIRRAGMWPDHARCPAIAYRPLVSFFPNGTAAEFRTLTSAGSARESVDVKSTQAKAIRYGVTDSPWFWEGEREDKERAAVVEGVIDMLSLVELGWKGHIFGLPGASSWKSCMPGLVRQSEEVGVKQFVLMLDNDNAGVEAAMEMAFTINEEARFRVNIRHPSGIGIKDINDVLKMKAGGAQALARS